MLTSRVTLKQFHIVFSAFILVISLIFISLFASFVYYGIDLICSLDVFYGNLYVYSLVVRFTPTSLLFSSLVSFIRSTVFIYSYYYMGFYDNYKFFLFTTLGFVISILIVINFADLFIVMLG